MMRPDLCDECFQNELRIFRDGDSRYIRCIACGATEELVEERQEVPA